MELLSGDDLEGFRAATRAWLEANCPATMRTPARSADDDVWGGRAAVFVGDPDTAAPAQVTRVHEGRTTTLRGARVPPVVHERMHLDWLLCVRVCG